LGVQIIDLNGMILKRSNNLGPMSVKDYAIALPTIRNGNSHRFYTTSESGTPLLVYTVPIIANQIIVGAVQVIKPVGAVEDTLNQVSRYLIIGTALSLILAAIVGAFLARRALAPVDTITQTAGAISRTKDLSRRLNIVNDTSEVGQLAATFNEMLDRIQQLFKTQERLIADVSHELRTPLTTVQGNLDLLRRYAATAAHDPQRAQQIAPMLQETMSEAESETARMSTMITDLLILAQVDSGALQLQREPVEMDTLLLDVYRQTRRIAQQRRGTNALEIRLGSEDQASVIGDRERLRQILLNLADNAVKYTPNGGIITFGLEKVSLEKETGKEQSKENNWVKITVSDTGIGISQDDQRHVFDRFYRTDKARSRELGGSGLGLSIAQWLAYAHDGKITVESEPQKGSTFTLWLPAYQESDTPIKNVPTPVER
jgi:signal transduction histidine kinase